MRVMGNDEDDGDHESDASECEGDINAPALPHLYPSDRVGLSGKELKYKCQLSIDVEN